MLPFIVGLAAATALPSVGMAPATGATEPQPLGLPAYWITADDYPATATQLRLEGTTAIELTVEPDGQTSRCKVTTSSNHDVLDKAACSVLRSRALFRPATDKDGTPTTGMYKQRVVWRLPEWEDPVDVGSTAHAEFTLNTDGTMADCTIENDGRVPSLLSEGLCKVRDRLPDGFVSAIRSSAGPGSLRVSVDVAFAGSEAAQARAEAERKGWERLSLTAATMTLNSSGWLSECNMVETRGAEELVSPICLQAAFAHFASPTAKDGKPTSRRYWYAHSYSVKRPAQEEKKK